MPARTGLSPAVPTCCRITPTSPVSASGKLKRNAQWIAGHVRDRAIAASCVAPSWPARSGWSAPATTASSEPTSRHNGKTTEREKSRIARSEEHTSELQSRLHLVCRLLLEKKKKEGADRNWRPSRAAET